MIEREHEGHHWISNPGAAPREHWVAGFRTRLLQSAGPGLVICLSIGLVVLLFLTVTVPRCPHTRRHSGRREPGPVIYTPVYLRRPLDGEGWSWAVTAMDPFSHRRGHGWSSSRWSASAAVNQAGGGHARSDRPWRTNCRRCVTTLLESFRPQGQWQRGTQTEGSSARRADGSVGREVQG